MTKASNGGICRVYDSNATLAPREHNIGGSLYLLSAHGDGTQVPLAHALQFLRDEAFVVLDEAGLRMKMQGPADERADIKLMPHQTIANLEELTIKALVIRAQRLPGGKGMNKNAGIKKLIQFVLAGGVPTTVDTEDLDPDTRDLIDDGGDDTDGDGDTGVADQALEGEQLPVI